MKCNLLFQIYGHRESPNSTLLNFPLLFPDLLATKQIFISSTTRTTSTKCPNPVNHSDPIALSNCQHFSDQMPVAIGLTEEPSSESTKKKKLTVRTHSEKVLDRTNYLDPKTHSNNRNFSDLNCIVFGSSRKPEHQQHEISDQNAD